MTATGGGSDGRSPTPMVDRGRRASPRHSSSRPTRAAAKEEAEVQPATRRVSLQRGGLPSPPMLSRRSVSFSSSASSLERTPCRHASSGRMPFAVPPVLSALSSPALPRSLLACRLLCRTLHWRRRHWADVRPSPVRKRVDAAHDRCPCLPDLQQRAAPRRESELPHDLPAQALLCSEAHSARSGTALPSLADSEEEKSMRMPLQDPCKCAATARSIAASFRAPQPCRGGRPARGGPQRRRTRRPPRWRPRALTPS